MYKTWKESLKPKKCVPSFKKFQDRLSASKKPRIEPEIVMHVPTIIFNTCVWIEKVYGIQIINYQT